MRKNTAGTTEGEAAVLEALPNGNVNIPGALSAGWRAYDYPVHTTDIPEQSAASVYYIKIGEFNYAFGARLVIREGGHAIEGTFYVDILNGQPSNKKIIAEYGKHAAGYGITGLLLAAPNGTHWAAPV